MNEIYSEKNSEIALTAPAQTEILHPKPQPAMGLALASMIIGIASYATFNPLAAILAIIFAGSAKKHGNSSGYATTGLACGIVGLILSVAVTLISVAIIMLAI